MDKLRSVFAVLVTVAIITVCGMFPGIVSVLTDRAHYKEADFITVSPVHLEIKPGLSPLGKLAVLKRADLHLEIPESKAIMTKQQVLDAVRQGLAPYVDAALISGVGENVEIRPDLFQIQTDPVQQTVVWLVELTRDLQDDPKSFTNVGLAIDDETGKILVISYTCEIPGETLVGKDALAAFSEIFFSGLGITDYHRFLVSDVVYAGDNGDAFRYHFTDELLGEIFIDLNVHDHGFYVEFPDY